MHLTSSNTSWNFVHAINLSQLTANQEDELVCPAFENVSINLNSTPFIFIIIEVYATSTTAQVGFATRSLVSEPDQSTTQLNAFILFIYMKLINLEKTSQLHFNLRAHKEKKTQESSQYSFTK